MPKFRKNQQVHHVKSGADYLITRIPNPLRILEYCREPFYEYVRYTALAQLRNMAEEDIDKRTYLRAQTEMEDGRFILYPISTEKT